LFLGFPTIPVVADKFSRFKDESQTKAEAASYLIKGFKAVLIIG
jgi:hypothetical protein